MWGRRVIPCLLYDGDGGLTKTVKFKRGPYIGDPINTVRIFNEKEVDEIMLLDISENAATNGPDFDFIEEFAQECFMPLCYGGGIQTLGHIDRLYQVGVEKVAINRMAHDAPELLEEATRHHGSQSIVGVVEARKTLLGYSTTTHSAKIKRTRSPADHALELCRLGVGEILVNDASCDGTYQGYDAKLIKSVSEASTVPIIACGGASKLADFTGAVNAGATAVAAGSIFVFQGPHRAVLITYPPKEELNGII